jgi:hypothetical protein
VLGLRREALEARLAYDFLHQRVDGQEPCLGRHLGLEFQVLDALLRGPVVNSRVAAAVEVVVGQRLEH